LVVLVALAGCGASAGPVEPADSATLSVSGYERTERVTSNGTRVFWDRSKSWEDPGNRTVTVTSHTETYRNASGDDAVVVHTLPKKPYVGADRVRAFSGTELAALATGPVAVRPRGVAEGATYRASLLGTEVTVRTLTDEDGTVTEHVARVAQRGVIVVVVVSGADRPTAERALDGVTL
jgi:hypothetical protein